MSTIHVETLKALLAAGADPTLLNKNGKTAGDQDRAQGLKEQADLLDAAVRARLGVGPQTPPIISK